MTIYYVVFIINHDIKYSHFDVSSKNDCLKLLDLVLSHAMIINATQNVLGVCQIILYFVVIICVLVV